MFQSALVRHPRFREGRLTTAFIAEEYPHGFRAEDVPPENPAFLAAVAAAVHRAYRDRAAGIEGQVQGHELRIDGGYVVVASDARLRRAGRPRAAAATTCASATQTFAIRHQWRFGEILMRGTCNGAPFAVQIERRGLRYRLTHRGTQFDVQVLPRRAAELLRLMPQQGAARPLAFPALADARTARRSRGEPGQEVKAGERLVVIEAMKMQNVILAERDASVAELLAQGRRQPRRRPAGV